jgi:Arc/MetJ family transcription regulator
MCIIGAVETGAALHARTPEFCPRRPKYTLYTHQVYDRCMSKVRTNIEIEDTYVEAIMDRYGVRTKTQAVDLALRHLAGQPMTREEALAMRGAHAISEIPDDTGPLDSA